MVIAGSVLLIFGCNALFAVSATEFSLGILLLFLILAVLEAFAIDAIAALAVRYIIPQSFYNPLSKRFKCLRAEKKLYTKLGIRKWKDKIPETGGLLVGFQKKHATDLHDNAYVYKFMQETCYAELMHILSIPLGFITLALCPRALMLTVALPVASVNAFLQLLPVMVQRFIRPQLMRVYKANQKRNNGKQEGI